MMERFIKAAYGLAFFLALTCPAHAQSTDDLAPLILAPTRPAPLWIASTDPKNQNNDYFLLQPGETRRVPLAAGTLLRLWSTSSEPSQLSLTLENSAKIPLLAKNRAILGLWSGDEGKRAFTLYPSLGSFQGFRKLGQGATLVATNGANKAAKWYFQATIEPPTPLANPLPKPVSLDFRRFLLDLAPGEEKTLENWDTPGLIYELGIANEGTGKLDFQTLRLRGEWDGQVGVDAPLIALAGQQAGSELVQNAVADFDGTNLVLRWPMPFSKGKLAVKNTGDAAAKMEVTVRLRRYIQLPTPFRFCAVSQSAVAPEKKPVEILNLTGAGAFCGLALQIAPGEGSMRRTFAFLEGNEFLIADGKTYEGTGTEDYFSSAWYFPEKPFIHPFEGMTQKIAMPPQVAAYRLQIPDALPFQKSFRFDFEHGNGNNAAGMNWNWTAFWYQKAPFSLPKTEGPLATSPKGEWERKGSKSLIFGALVAGILVGIAASFFRRRRVS